MRRPLVLITFTALAVISVTRLFAQPPVKAFQGYWMGVDPVDGGDARRSIVRQEDGTFAMAARDTVFTLCDRTDLGLGTFADGTVVGRRVMSTNNLRISCFNNGAQVTLRARYELVSDGLMIEVATLQDGTPVSTIILHKVSHD
jgi:hypothetical protein